MDISTKKLYKLYFHNLGDNSEVLDYQVLNTILEQGPLTVEEVRERLNITNLITHALERMTLEGLLDKAGDSYQLLNKRTDEDLFGSIDQEQDKIPKRSSKTEDLGDLGPRMSSSMASRKRHDMEAESKTDDLDIDSLLDDTLGESIEDFVSDLPDLLIEDEGSGVIPPLVDILKELGYITNQDPKETEEYQLLTIVLDNYPISGEDISQRITTDSLSLSLSNLTADGLIVQTNDYRYTITKKLYKRLKEFIATPVGGRVQNEDSKLFSSYINQESLQFKQACHQLGYIEDPQESLETLLTIPEFEVLHIIRNNQPIASDGVKQRVNHTLPVVVSRMLSKLHADEVVVTDMNDHYLTTDKLLYLMVRPKLVESLSEDEFEELQVKYE